MEDVLRLTRLRNEVQTSGLGEILRMNVTSMDHEVQYHLVDESIPKEIEAGDD